MKTGSTPQKKKGKGKNNKKSKVYKMDTKDTIQVLTTIAQQN